MYNGTLAVAGECMCTRPFSNNKEPEFLNLFKILREADTAYCHMEMNLIDKNEGYPGRAYAVSGLKADPVIGKELKDAGVDIVSTAYNHALDWGVAGLQNHIANLDRSGLVHAGIGHCLEEAREPAYFESSAGRVALISISTGHHPYDNAGITKAPNRGRPGVNPLRIVQKYVVEQSDLDNMVALWKKMGLSMRPRFFSKPDDGDVTFNMGDHGGGNSATFIFRPGDKPEVITIVDPVDLDDNLRMIRDARRQADLVIVCHHAAVNDGARGDAPAKMVPPFAKSCIDAGADVFIGHGWHRQLGIELYNDKPIFYGTGNFFAQSQFLQRFPGDTYEGHGLDITELARLTPADLHDKREGHMAHWAAQPWGLVASLDIQAGAVKGLKLHPFMLSCDGDKKPTRLTGTRLDGRPLLASGKDAETVIGHVSDLSKRYGTKIDFQNGLGVVKL